MKHLPLNTPHFESLCKDFDTFVKAKGYRQGKGSQNQSCVREFLFFIESKGFTTIQHVKAPQIVDYYEYLRERPNQRRDGGLSESMIRHHLYALRLFFDHLVDADELDSSPARLPKFQLGKHKERNLCTVEEIKQMYGVCKDKTERALLGIRANASNFSIFSTNTRYPSLHQGVFL